jgi:recombination protein RecT
MEQQHQLTPFEEGYATVHSLIMSPAMQGQFAAALPRSVDPERFARLVLTEIRRIPRLLDCTRESMLGAMMEAAQLGLDIGSRGHAWILPYKIKGTMTATLITGYKGLLDLAWRSQKIKTVYAHEVCEGDFFEYAFGSEQYIRHRPAAKCDRGEISHAYAGCETVFGGKLMDVMPVEDIEAIRQRARARDSGPWVTDFPAMAVKTVVRRMLKLAPCSVELSRAITLDEQGEIGVPQGLEIEITPTAAPEPEPEPEPVKHPSAIDGGMICEECGTEIPPLGEFFHYDDRTAFRCVECGKREGAA